MVSDLLGNSAYGTATLFSADGTGMDGLTPLRAVLFADVSGSARLHEKLGGAETLRAVDRCLKRIERAVEGFGGRVVKIVGDELMAVFDVADEAFQAAVEMQQRVADLPPVSGVKLEIRVGFAQGEVRDEVGTLVGETVSLAAHLAGLAAPGQVLTSLQTQATLSPALKKSTRELTAQECRGRAGTFFEVLSPDSTVLPVNDPVAAGAMDAVRSGFLLNYAGRSIQLNERMPRISMGRAPDCDVVIRDRRASRYHATLEWQNQHVVLTDKSTNGTYVTLRGDAEQFVRGQVCMLRGRGVISFAASLSAADADCAEFEMV